MNFVEIIKEYQTLAGTLAGSFLAIISSILLWSLKEWYESRNKIKNNKKEIENIFFMAARESEDALKDIKMYIVEARKGLDKSGEKIFISVPPKLNRIYVNEERLFLLKNNLGFLFSQQIEIAISSAKKFNGYLDQIESVPIFIFDSIIKMLETNILSKDEAMKDYKIDQIRYLNNTEFLLKNDFLVAQRHLFRPIVVQLPKYKNLPKSVDVDKELDADASIPLSVMKWEASLD